MARLAAAPTRQPGGPTMKLKQIVISIENSPNRLYRVLKELGDAGVNLRAMNLVDTGAFGQLRLLVSDVALARQVLMGLHIPAYVNEVVAAEIDDRPGSLSEILRMLMAADVRVAFMYAFMGTAAGKAVMIFRFTDNDKAITLLRENGIRILGPDIFNMTCSDLEG
jgi:hypothetical protein